MTKLRYVDLFAGIGGMRLAFEQATSSFNLETECVFSCEINKDAQAVYQSNFSHQPFGNIRLVAELSKHDVLPAGFPCQSFSYTGKKAVADTRGTLFFEICRLIDTSKPKLLKFENVPTLLTNDCGLTFEAKEAIACSLVSVGIKDFSVNSISHSPTPESQVIRN